MTKIFASDNTEEIWECNENVIIADVASALRINNAQAKHKISKATIDNPLEFIHRDTKVSVWVE